MNVYEMNEVDKINGCETVYHLARTITNIGSKNTVTNHIGVYVHRENAYIDMKQAVINKLKSIYGGYTIDGFKSIDEVVESFKCPNMWKLTYRKNDSTNEQYSFPLLYDGKCYIFNDIEGNSIKYEVNALPYIR